MRPGPPLQEARQGSGQRILIASPSSAYRTLLRSFGPQGWWPLSRPGSSRPEYRPGVWGGLSERQRLEVCLGAILTQNTNWSNASRAVESLGRERMTSLRKLRRAPLGRLQRLIRTSGYFRQKALKIREFAGHVLRRGGGLRGCLSGPLPERRQELLAVRGIGPETADSMLLYAGQRTIFLVDAYTLRIGARIGWFGPKTGYDQAAAFFTTRLPRSDRLYGEYHALLVELAKRCCRKSDPLCAGCPLSPGCRRGRRLPAGLCVHGGRAGARRRP